MEEHRLVYAKDDVSLAGGVGLKKGKEIEAGENGGRELMSEEFYVVGRVEVGSKVEVREIDEAKESVVGDNRVEEDVDGRERGDLGGGGGRKREDGHHPQCREHDSLRPSCSSAGLGVGPDHKKMNFFWLLQKRTNF